MFLAFTISIIAFLMLVLAGMGKFGAFPDNVQWIGMGLAIFGAVISSQSVFQAIAGRPKLSVEFEVSPHENERSLMVFLKNEPLSKTSFWTKIGVRRSSIQSLSASFQLAEFGSGKIILPILNPQIYCSDEERFRNIVSVPPTLPPSASLIIGMWNDEKKVLINTGDRRRQPFGLKKGRYKIEIIFLVDGIPQSYTRDFIVGVTPDELMWVNPPQSTPQKLNSKVR